MTIRTDDQWLQTFLLRGIDGAKEMLSRGELDTDILCGIAVMLADFRENGLCILHTGVEEGVYLQPFAYLFL